jgi:hydroxypyruvate reductase
MIIKNFKKLATTNQKKLTLSVLESGLNAAMPNLALKKIIKQNYVVLGKQKISLKNYERIYVVAIGKAADLMTKTVNSLTKIDGGVLVIPQNTRSMITSKKFILQRASHPIPDYKSVIATKKTIDFLAKLQQTDFVIFLISGGASSLLSLPDGISIREKQAVTRLLLRSDANIQEINCVRKHLSKVKGGQLVEFLRCQAVALVMSDVIGDDLSSIASGLTYYDNTTFQDAKRIIIRYGLKNKVPKKVWQRIDLGAKKLIHETPKKAKVKNYVISSNKNCLDEMSSTARKLGLITKTVSQISGNVENAALKLIKLLPSKSRSCLIFGGETTVKVKGKGKGGRNQELILHLLNRLSKQKINLVMASVGTDGIDGNTPAAGAIVTSDMTSKMINKYLRDNDSYAYFKKYGGLIFTGPTHTNLMDIGLILRI